jgi:hypothetical protein
LYEFLTGTGYYQNDPFLDPDCTSSLMLGGEGMMDEFEGEPSPAYPAGEALETPTEAPYFEDDFTDEEAPTDEEALDLLPQDAAQEPDTFDLEILDDGELPAPQTTPDEEPMPEEPMPEEPPFSLDLIAPTEPAPAQPEPTPPTQPAPTQPEDREPLEDPFPLDVPETKPTPPVDAMPESDLEDMLDLPPTEPKPDSEPEPDAEPPREPEPKPDAQQELDELDLFDDEISPDLQLDFPETGDDATMDDGANLPLSIYPSARRPAADSYFGRCLFFPTQSQRNPPRVVQDRGARDTARRPHALSKSTEIVAPHPGRGIFDTALPGDEDETENVRAAHEAEPRSDRR